ncbi:MAG: hypothetical protein GC179_08055 [Anaerolineaceae bacterium]|nr:hypothetical protein [Anaerolineaceae bacterium]
MKGLEISLIYLDGKVSDTITPAHYFYRFLLLLSVDCLFATTAAAKHLRIDGNNRAIHSTRAVSVAEAGLSPDKVGTSAATWEHQSIQ